MQLPVFCFLEYFLPSHDDDESSQCIIHHHSLCSVFNTCFLWSKWLSFTHFMHLFYISSHHTLGRNNYFIFFLRLSNIRFSNLSYCCMQLSLSHLSCPPLLFFFFQKFAEFYEVI